MRIDGNEIADYLTRESSHPLIGPEHALGISEGCQGSNWELDKQET